ncbi:MAG TPA: FtsX-like permease family protein [Anaeromyxobacteraceae bacterium]|nr:FtsX-like permease family protein [Anaeromyxobacteraceae bacterium]
MRIAALVDLANRTLRADPRRALVDTVACCAGAAALVFFVALGLGTGDAVRRLFPGEARLVEVIPSGVSLGPVLGGARLDDVAVGRLRALRGVAAAYPKLNLRVPVTASRAPEGLGIYWPPNLALQVPSVGVPRELVADDLPKGAPFADPGPGGAIPVVLAKRLLEVYNGTIAPSWGSRRLPPGPALVGLQVPIQIGQSMLMYRTEKRVVEGRLVLAGFSDRVPLYQAALPIETVRRLHQEYGKTDEGYSSVAVFAREPDDVPSIAAAVRRMGFAVDQGERAVAERIGSVIALATAALSLLAVLMLALAALAVAQSLFATVRARAKELAVLRAVGASASDVRTMVLAEAALLGLFGGVLGAVVARLAALAADALLARMLPELPFLPETFFAFSWWVWMLGPLVSMAAALAGAVAPASLAARLDPARALA